MRNGSYKSNLNFCRSKQPKDLFRKNHLLAFAAASLLVMQTYFIGNNMNSLIKIGKSKDINKRVKKISGQISFIKLSIIHSIEGDHEYELHNYFKEYRQDGEWFGIPEYATFGKEWLIKKVSSIISEKDISISIQAGSFASDEKIQIGDMITELLLNIDKIGIKVIFWCGFNCQRNTNIISLGKATCDEITKEFKIGYQTIKNSIYKLAKAKALIPLGSGTYRVNPRYFWKGQTSEKLKVMKYVLEIECPGALH